MAKTLAISTAAGATVNASAVSNSVDTHPTDHAKAHSGGGGT